MEDFGVVETHISKLVFSKDHVYKVKKPVAFGFVDLSSTSARYEACRAEVELNSRLAPGVYEGVGVFRRPDGTAEPVVVMRRLPAERSLSGLIAAENGRLEDHLSGVARAMAGFHRHAQRSTRIDSACTPSALTVMWRRNIAEWKTVAGPVIDSSELDALSDAASRYIDGRQALIIQRIVDERIVDGHGDLLCDDVFCLDSGPLILDCLEFSPTLRHVDTLSDVASLAADLEYHGRADLAEFFLATYRCESGDAWPDSLAHFYLAYRFAVRGKVASIRARGRDGSEFATEARERFESARRHLEASEAKLVLVGGLPGTGKSTLARQLRDATGWPVVSSDVLRKQLAGLDPGEDAGSAFGTGLYAPEATATVYSALLAEAEALLGLGFSVILDASWLRQTWRDAAAAVATKCRARLVAIQCEAGDQIIHRRIQSRRATGDLVSDATVDIADAMAAAVEPWRDANALDTSLDLRDSVVMALSILGL